MIIINNKNKELSTHRWLNAIKRLAPMVNILHSRPHDENVQKLYDLVQNLLDRGEAEAIKVFKAYKLVLQQSVLQQPISELPFCKLSKKGVPKVLKPWWVDHTSPICDIRYTMSIFRISEVFQCKPEYKVNSIIDSTNPKKDVMESIMNFISTWSSLQYMPKENKGYLIMSNKAGPNGPASVSCIDDLKPLRADPQLYSSVKSLLKVAIPWLDIDGYQEGTGKRHSKLVLLADKACKTRVIAIGDWWSNVALSGIHKDFMKFLSKLPSDVTYRQDKIPVLLKGLGPDLYSADMTAFTDVFPIELEAHLVSTVYGVDIGLDWKQVISNRTFDHPLGDVRYAAGNPMGLLSSWPVSTATHHAVKQWCAHQLGVGKKYKYLMLGDDSLDTCPKVHKLYLETMNLLGVSTSTAKCTQSELGSAEFAKRLFLHSEEVTGLPITILDEVMTKPEQFLELLRICRERGYNDSSLIPGFTKLATRHKSAKLLTDLLSLPESITGTPPLTEVNTGSWSDILSHLEQDHKTLIAIARDYIFWRETKDLEKPLAVNPTSSDRISISENHPILVAVSFKLMEYLDHEDGDDDFSIYNGWMDGNYRLMANVPNVDKYRYKNKGHKVTKSKYEVLKLLLALASGNCNIPLHKPSKLSNFDLFVKGYPQE
jgi:hypothetical protein